MNHCLCGSRSESGHLRRRWALLPGINAPKDATRRAVKSNRSKFCSNEGFVGVSYVGFNLSSN
jgi:hypothetical protein